MFATCSWPSLCEQSELQCWRRNRRLCGSVQISATRVLPLTFDISILNALPFRGAVASLPILIFLDFEHPTCPPENTSRKSCIPTCRRTPSQIHPFHIPDAIVSRPRCGRLSSQTRADALLFSFIISDIPKKSITFPVKNDMNISIILNNIQDPRRNHLQKHSLETIIYITLAAVIGGAESWYEIEEFGNTHIDFFKSKIEGLEEIPSHDTFNRVFSIIKPKEFESGFRQWVQELYGTYKGIIAIDGKEMRGAKSEDENGKICPIRMVSAWAVDNGVSLGQEKVGEKSNEIKAIPKLLKILDLEGCIVTIDAIGCQHEIVKEVIENKGDYLIAVKENQQKLHKSLSSWFSEVDIEGFKKGGHGHYPPTRYQYCTQENHGHGRTEKRICRVISYQSYTEKIVHWEGVRSLVCIENTRTDNKTGETTSENHYYITSLPMDAETILNVARKHWGIENNLHWQLDVSFNEDNQKKKKNAAQNISLINKIALARIKQDETKGSMKTKRKRAGWDSSFLAKLIP